MAILQKIRNRTGLLIFIVGLAMVSFILFDLAKSFFSPQYERNNILGVVDGVNINFESFNQKYNQAKTNYAQQNFNLDESYIMNITWEQILSNIIISKIANSLGIIVPRKLLLEELSKQSFISNLNELKDENGNVDYSKLVSYINESKNNPDPRYSNMWSELIESIELNIQQRIYNDLITDGIAISPAYAEMRYEQENTKIDLDYVKLDYSSMDNSKINVSNEEIQEYINTHEEDFIIKENRDLQIIAIDRKPSERDYDMQFNMINSLKKDFSNTKNDSIFVNSNSDIAFDRNYYHKNNIKDETLNKEFFKIKIGEIYGPYKSKKDKEFLNISKLISAKKIPDSVKFSQILISHNQSNFNNRKNISKERAKKISDSLYSDIIKTKSNFDKIVNDFSDDNLSKKNNGSVGWITFGKTYNNINDFCFFKSSGSIGLFETPLGYHIIRIDDQKNFGKALQFATISKELYPSENTEDSLYRKCTEIANSNINSLDDFISNANKLNLDVKTLEEVDKMDYNLTGLGNNRAIVKWAFNKKREYGDLEIFDTENHYLVVFLSGLIEKGKATVDEAKYKVMPILLKDKKYKALSEKLLYAEKNSLEKISDKLGIEVKNALNVSLKNIILTGSGKEPSVIGASFYPPINKVYGPIKGENGVFMIKPTKRTKSEKLEYYSSFGNNEKNEFLSTIRNIMPLLQETLEIKDNRHIFY